MKRSLKSYYFQSYKQSFVNPPRFITFTSQLHLFSSFNWLFLFFIIVHLTQNLSLCFHAKVMHKRSYEMLKMFQRFLCNIERDCIVLQYRRDYIISRFRSASRAIYKTTRLSRRRRNSSKYKMATEKLKIH